MSKKEWKAPAAKKPQTQPMVLNIIKPKFNHPTMRWPSLDFVAGLFMGGVIAVVDYAKGGEMYLNWKPIEGSKTGECEISFKLATEVVLADIEIAKALVEMYGWEFTPTMEPDTEQMEYAKTMVESYCELVEATITNGRCRFVVKERE